jgi:hypothetical protein
VVWVVSAVVLVALGAAGAFALRGRKADRPTAQAPTSTPLPITPTETVRIAVPVPTPPAPDTTRGVTPPPLPAAPDAPAPSRPTDDVRARRRFTAAQVVALGIRARARNRGADPAALQAGDVTARRADSLARAGEYAAAVAELRNAQQQWMLAEQAATGAVSGERAEIEGVIAAFAEAFRSRDLSRIRRAYPGMTPAQAQEWGTFFMDAHRLDVRLDLASFESRGDEVVAQLTGGLDWESLKTGRPESRTVSYRATMQRERSGFKLVSLR